MIAKWGWSKAVLRWLDSLPPKPKLRAMRALQELLEVELQAAVEKKRWQKAYRGSDG